MNEPTNRPIVVGFGSVPGGTGCTTLAIHAATFAARQGLHTLAISIDSSADMLRRLGCDEACIDGHWTKERRLKLAYIPPETATYNLVEYLPNLGFGGEVGNPEIIILDFGPGLITPCADFWVVPIQDSRSLASIEQRAFPLGIYKTLFVISQVPIIARRRFRESARDCLKTVDPEMAQLLGSDVPRSGLLRRTASERKTIWDLTKRSLTTLNIETFCRELLGKVDPAMDARFEAEDKALLAKAMGIGAPLANAPVSPPFDDAATLKAAQELAVESREELQAGIETNPPTKDKPDSVSNGVRPSRRSKKGGT